MPRVQGPKQSESKRPHLKSQVLGSAALLIEAPLCSFGCFEARVPLHRPGTLWPGLEPLRVSMGIRLYSFVLPLKHGSKRFKACAGDN